jgi:hypothetical protein
MNDFFFKQQIKDYKIHWIIKPCFTMILFAITFLFFLCPCVINCCIRKMNIGLQVLLHLIFTMVHSKLNQFGVQSGVCAIQVPTCGWYGRIFIYVKKIQRFLWCGAMSKYILIMLEIHVKKIPFTWTKYA